jgi:hypothetical protein
LESILARLFTEQDEREDKIERASAVGKPGLPTLQLPLIFAQARSFYKEKAKGCRIALEMSSVNAVEMSAFFLDREGPFRL